MPHWKKLMDPKEFLFAFDLDGREITLEIEKVVAGEMTGEQGKKSKKPVATFIGTKKKLALNTTNCKTIVQLYGTNEVNDWAGKRITLFPTTTSFGGTQMDCIRIKPVLPPADTAKSKKPGAESLRQDEEPAA